MQDFPTWVPVAALALQDDRGRLLLQQRMPGKRHAGQWEFPGGKVEIGENPRSALVREIAEELAITLDQIDLSPSLMADERGDPAIVLFLYICRRWQGEPRGCEGQEWGWFSPTEAAALPLAPMDRDLLARLEWAARG